MIRTSVAARNAELDALAALCNGGSIRIYAGKRPRSVESEVVDDPIAVCRLESPAFKPAKSGSIKSNDIQSEIAAKEGVASWFQVVSKDGEVVWDGDCTQRGKGGSCELDHLSVQSGADVAISSLVYSLPE